MTHERRKVGRQPSLAGPRSVISPLPHPACPRPPSLTFQAACVQSRTTCSPPPGGSGRAGAPPPHTRIAAQENTQAGQRERQGGREEAVS